MVSNLDLRIVWGMHVSDRQRCWEKESGSDVQNIGVPVKDKT